MEEDRNEFVEKFKDMSKMIFKKIFSKYKYKIYLIVFIIVLMLLPLFTYFIKTDTGTLKEGDNSNVPYAVSTYINEITFSEDGIKFSKTSQEIWDEMIANGCKLEDYLDSPDELQKLMNAEVITQYPKLPNLGNDKLNGVIQFERHKTDGTQVYLKYINLDTFNSYIENNDISVMDYYTLDETGNLLIGSYNKVTETLTTNDSDIDVTEYSELLTNDNKNVNNYERVDIMVSKMSIPYKRVVEEKYTMPFNYLWAFLVISDDKDFVFDLADLVEESEMTISIYDNITTNKNENTYAYNKEFKYETTIALTNGVSRTWGDGNEKYPADYSKDNVDYYINDTIIYENNKPIVELTKANVWIVDYSREYTYQKNEEVSSETNTANLDDTEFGNEIQVNNDPFNHAQSLLNEYIVLDDENEDEEDTVKFSAKVKSKVCKISSKMTNRKNESKNTEYVQKYVEGNVKKDVKDENDSSEKNFVTILLAHKDAKNAIKSASDWLFEIISKSVPDMEDLTRYLLYKALNVDYGVTKYDFSEYESSSFLNAGTGIYNGSIQEKVWFALKDLDYSDEAVAGAMGNIDYESSGFSTVAVESNGEGIGLCQWSFDRKKNLKDYANSKGLTWEDEDTQVEFLIGEISGQGPAAQAGYAHQRTSGKIILEGITSTESQWAGSATVDEATLHFMRFFESPKSKSSLTERQLRAQKYYQEFQGRTAYVNVDITLTGENKEKMQQLISEAVRIANDDTYQYSQSFRESENYYDCSSFVSRLYTKYFGISRLDYGSNAKGTDNIRSNCISNKVSVNDLQPGDILWKNGHVALYIGNNQVAEAKNSDKGIVVGTLNISNFTEAYRIIK